MIGKHESKQARNTNLKGAIAIGLDEALTALEESLTGLTDDQVRAFPILGRNNIAWIAMHCLQNLDIYANVFQTGHRTFEHGRRWDLWNAKPEERPKLGDPFPSQEELTAMLRKIGAGAKAGLASASENDLMGRRLAENWWPGMAADAYMRTIMHTMAHVRQIWLLRGALGLVDGKSWPQQHWA